MAVPVGPVAGPPVAITGRVLKMRLLVVGLLALGCTQTDFDRDEHPRAPLGPKWGDGDVSCQSNSDCDPGEECRDGVCQMERCGNVATSESSPPFTDVRVLRQDSELVVSDRTASQSKYGSRGFPGELGGPMDLGWTWSAEDPIADLAGGRFFDNEETVIALATQGSSIVRFPSANHSGALSFVPVALAAADTDADGRDELVAVGASGKIALCAVKPWSCVDKTPADLSDGVDASAADVDGDGFDEVLLLADGGDLLLVWNLDTEVTGHSEEARVALADGVAAIGAGDVNSDGVAEVVGLQDGGWFGLYHDTLFVWRIEGSSAGELAQMELDSGTVDVAVGDIDSDLREETMVLRNDRQVDVVRLAGGALETSHSIPTGGIDNPGRLALADLDEDSPKGRLVAGPELVSGDVVPTMVVHLPPYYRSHSHEDPWILIGDLKAKGSETSQTVGLHYQALVGTEFEAFGNGFDLSVTVGRELEKTTAYERERAVGPSLELVPDVEQFGDEYAGVVVACACYQSYTYEIEDPRGLLAPDSTRFVTLMPIGGTVQFWSTMRYNAMAEQAGLPHIEVPYRVGDPSSYPSTFQRADGSPVPAEDFVFADAPTVSVSDVGLIGWEMMAADMITNETAMTTSVEVDAEVLVGGVKFGVGAGGSRGAAQAVSVGTEMSILGLLPPVLDDPATPEDEHDALKYSFRPSFYREHYTDRNGNDAGYYVLSYAVDEK